MERITIDPRPNWSSEIEKLGFDFYLMDGIPYWTENAYYHFAAAEIDEIEAAANKVHRLCIYAVQRIIDERLFPLLGIEPELVPLIAESWDRKDPAIYGRFDMMYDGKSPPKLLEYNADTPTSLFEASIVQWNWREQRFPKSDQFNSIHEHLVARWQNLLVGRRNADRLYVTTATPMPEDEATVQYIGRTAEDAGYKVKFLPIQEIGWHDDGLNAFVDLDGTAMRQIFKLYPWEWLMRDDFGAHIRGSGSVWLEPAWKMLLSNKGLLPILWDMFPEHENLLPAFREPSPLQGKPMVRKPLLGREGNNIGIYDPAGHVLAETDGRYAEGSFVYQAYAEPPEFSGCRANLGVWMVHDEACGMGVREDNGLIISNSSRFVPHTFD
jgi:glutathionylspermidine synthase